MLFAILFLWQIPHFLAIAWIYREDYARGGLPMLPGGGSGGRGHRPAGGGEHPRPRRRERRARRRPAWRAPLYLAGAIALGLMFTAAAVWAAVQRTMAAARDGSSSPRSLYLSLLCTLLIVDRA